MDNTKFISVAQASDLLNCSPRTIQNMIHRGTINAWKIDPQNPKSAFRIPQSEVQKVLDQRQANNQ